MRLSVGVCFTTQCRVRGVYINYVPMLCVYVCERGSSRAPGFTLTTGCNRGLWSRPYTLGWTQTQATVLDPILLHGKITTCLLLTGNTALSIPLVKLQRVGKAEKQHRRAAAVSHLHFSSDLWIILSTKLEKVAKNSLQELRRAQGVVFKLIVLSNQDTQTQLISDKSSCLRSWD